MDSLELLKKLADSILRLDQAEAQLQEAQQEHREAAEALRFNSVPGEENGQLYEKLNAAAMKVLSAVQLVELSRHAMRAAAYESRDICGLK